MTIPSRQRAVRVFCVLAVICFAFAGSSRADESSKPVFLYSRHFNAKGEGRYLPDGQYRDVLERLRAHFDVRVNDDSLNAQTLHGVAAVLISNPSDKAFRNNPPPHHMSADDVRELTQFVESGGGLIAMGNQENHNLEINDFNHLLGNFGMKFVSNYTDAKPIGIPQDVPIIGGLRWAYYTGNQIVIDPSNAARVRPLVMNDAAKPLGGPRNPKGILLAVAEPGKGRVVLVTDAGWITNDALSGKGIGKVSIKEQDNWEIFLHLTNWAAGRRTTSP